MSSAAPLMTFPDLQTGLNFLGRVPLANPTQALPALRHFYTSLIRNPLPASAFLKLLEHARGALASVLEVNSRRFLSRSLPLGDAEDAALRETCDGWQLAANAYARCAQMDSGDDAEHADRIALILHRCVHYTGLIIHEHYLARREVPPGLWLDLYGYYASAEEWGIATRPVVDGLDSTTPSTHCAAALVTVLLTDLAGPYSYDVREIGLIRRWAAAWSPLVSIHHASVGDNLPHYVIDLMQEGGLKFSSELAPNNDQRYLDTSRLAIRLQEVLVQLKQRISPAQLGLGAEVTGVQCAHLLETLARPWTQAAAPRRFRRRPASGTARMAISFEAIHYLTSGAEFTQPQNLRQYSGAEFDRLFTFRHMVDPTQQLLIRRKDFDVPVDDWRVLNQSATGFRLDRTVAGQKLAHSQLIGLRPPDGDRFLLAQTHWLMQGLEGGLVAGVGVMPGVPVAIAARATGANVSFSEPYSRAFMLPEVPAMGAKQSLVLAQGWYHTGRVIEIFTDTAWRVKLTALIDRGVDFERVGYVLYG